MSQNRLRESVWHPNDRLISTKLHIPLLKSRMLPREHLVDRLSAGKDSRLIVILGVAASGKTSLTCQWINKDKLPAAWYSLDKTDNEFDIFFRYFLTALSKVESELASALLPRLQSRRKLSTKEIIPLIIERFTDLSGDIYLILDDYHLITSGEIHDALSYFLNHMPSKMHMVVISRHNIPFSLAHFKVRNQITEISPQDMRFNDKETGKYFAEIIPLKLSTDEVRELARYTEGWVGALQLFGLSLKGKETLHGLSNILNRADSYKPSLMSMPATMKPTTGGIRRRRSSAADSTAAAITSTSSVNTACPMGTV